MRGKVEAASLRLDFQQRFRLAWELTWPMAVIDAAVVLAVHGLFDAQGETWDSIWAVASFFAVWPWVIRRALRRVFGNAKVRVVRIGNQYGDSLRYQESLKVMWLLEWRATVLLLAAALVVSLGLRVTGRPSHDFSTQSPLANSLGLSGVDAVSNLLFIPLLIPGMLRKRFRGFHLELLPAGGARKP